MIPARAVLRSSSDALFVALALVYGAALVLTPSIPLVAVGLWWTANTIGHNFIHRPFFTRPWMNATFSALLTGLLGFPQSLWRQRHLAHHADRAWHLTWTRALSAELILVGAIWAAMIAVAPLFFATIYLPGYAAGLLLCALQGHYEHARGTTSHYGRIYNLLCFNDGYHVEHHARPAAHWTDLPHRIVPDARASHWPPLLRWLDHAWLHLLERLVLHSRTLERLVVNSHCHALERVTRDLPRNGRVAIVGGGLFPRTALILQELLPAARIVVIDADARHLEIARARLGDRGDRIEFVHRRYGATERSDVDLVVIPLSFEGNREALYREPPAPAVLIHDWLWRRRGTSVVVSPFLLKRVNLVRRAKALRLPAA